MKLTKLSGNIVETDLSRILIKKPVITVSMEDYAIIKQACAAVYDESNDFKVLNKVNVSGTLQDINSILAKAGGTIDNFDCMTFFSDIKDFVKQILAHITPEDNWSGVERRRALKREGLEHSDIDKIIVGLDQIRQKLEVIMQTMGKYAAQLDKMELFHAFHKRTGAIKEFIKYLDKYEHAHLPARKPANWDLAKGTYAAWKENPKQMPGSKNPFAFK